MKLIQLPKGKGKTTQMLMWLLEGHAKSITRALIVTDQKAVDRLSKQLHNLWRENGQPPYINNAANRIYRASAVVSLGWQHFRNMEVGIDDADLILQYLLFNTYRDVSIASMTCPDDGLDESETIFSDD